jgi:SRSO17 transposase
VVPETHLARLDQIAVHRLRTLEGLKLVVGIESVLQVWANRKQWPLPGSRDSAPEVPLLAASTRSRTSASMA